MYEKVNATVLQPEWFEVNPSTININDKIKVTKKGKIKITKIGYFFDTKIIV